MSERLVTAAAIYGVIKLKVARTNNQLTYPILALKNIGNKTSILNDYLCPADFILQRGRKQTVSDK